MHGPDLDDGADPGDLQEDDVGDLAVGERSAVGTGGGRDLDDGGADERGGGHGHQDVVGLDRVGAGGEGHHARQALQRQHLRSEEVDIGRQPAGVGDGGSWVLGACRGGDGKQQDAQDGGGETGHDVFSLWGWRAVRAGGDGTARW